MRVLTVSAHYPPNFVSGGTLQPQRISRALRDRGHEVSVFAGWLGDRPPLDEWDEADETGMAVHWIATKEFIGWADDRNWDNPAVTEAFRRHLERVRPDVVHLHSLQSLGAGLLPAARAAGARVVVTMHDFWWLCSRQFLADPEYTPCSIVVEAGACPCQVDEAWRRERASSLRGRLASADLVLAPSRSAAEVLDANGVGGPRLVVDENGLDVEALEELLATVAAAPVGTAAPAGRRPDPVLRVLYAGGPNAMKGAGVLLDALEELGDLDGWRLTAHGLDGYLEEHGRTLPPGPVDLRPPFGPGELAPVLAAHDVVLVPSVARETHSLLTREALLAGRPVVCTDVPGPEEVVADGVNGLVVPAGDPASLAGAIRRLVTEPGLLDTLRDGAAAPVPVRSLDEQVEAMVPRLEALVHGGAAAQGAPGPVRRVTFVVGIQGAPLRYRARLPAEALALRAVDSEVLHYLDPRLVEACTRADAVVMYRVPATVRVLDAIETTRAAGIPVAFDVDDLIVDPGIVPEVPALAALPPDQLALYVQGVERYRTTLEACDAYIGSTAMLTERVAELTGLPTHRFDNGVGIELGRVSDLALRRPRRPGPVRIGYFSGTTTHDDDWAVVEPAVAAVLEARPDVELWLGGLLGDTPALARFGDRVVRLPFVPWYELPDILRDLDVNLAPLSSASRFNEAKSAIKWLEAALVATPTIASPTGPFREAIEHGRTGLLAADTTEWEPALLGLIDDADGRSRLGGLARRRALLEWSPWRQGERYAAILGDLVAAGPRLDRRSSWAPVVVDEPPTPVVLEPYPGPTAGPAGPVGPARPAPEAAPRPSPRRLVQAARRDGVGPTAKRVGAMAERRLRAAREAWRNPGGVAG